MKFQLKHKGHVIHTGTWEECYAKLCEKAFQNSGMTIMRAKR